MPLEIRYRNAEKDTTLDNIIQKEYLKLQKIYSGIKSCRITIEKPHTRQHTGRLYCVSLMVSVSGHGEIVMKEEPTSLLKSRVSLEREIRDIFELIERKLIKIKEKRASDIKRPRTERSGSYE